MKNSELEKIVKESLERNSHREFNTNNAKVFTLEPKEVLVKKYDEKGNFSWVLSTIIVKSYDPQTDAGRVALFQHLDSATVGLPFYASTFPEILTGGVTGTLAKIHNIALMTEWAVDSSSVAGSAGKNINSYKNILFDGPTGEDMTSVPVS